RGVGEVLSPIRGMELPLLIVRGSRGVSTGRLFASLGVGSERRSRLPEGALSAAIRAIEGCDAAALAAALGNALRPAAEEVAPEIAEYASMMMDSGALGASMTGSGAAVFGIFADAAAAEKAAESFRGCDFVCCCKTLV
ncbi:MAG: hypothetical protein J5772_04215, partial [Clostridia bacterium]|nr:hypothetical protein [Clostridia bacterium]